MVKRSSYADAGIAGVLTWIAAIVLLYAWVPFGLKFLVDVFVMQLPFWSSFFYGVGMWLLTEIVALICAVLFGGLAAISMKRKR